MKIQKGMVFRDFNNKKCHIVNVFYDDEDQVVTYKHWSKHRNRWVFTTEYTDIFMLSFDSGFEWE
jgi:hypothetical protein